MLQEGKRARILNFKNHVMYHVSAYRTSIPRGQRNLQMTEVTTTTVVERETARDVASVLFSSP